MNKMDNIEWKKMGKPETLKEYLWVNNVLGLVKSCPRCRVFNTKRHTTSIWAGDDRPPFPMGNRIMCRLCFTYRNCIEHFKTSLDPGTGLPWGMAVDYWYWEIENDRTDKQINFKLDEHGITLGE